MAFCPTTFMHNANRAFIDHQGDQRYGQFLVNYATKNYPGLFAGMPDDCDCFYDNNKVEDFLRYVFAYGEEFQYDN